MRNIIISIIISPNGAPPQKLPRQVPLPEVSHYTEDIVFGGLGFPVGFDQSSIIVNLRSFERIRKTVGLSTTSVYAATGEAEPFDTGVNSVDAQGAATIGLTGKRHKKPLASSSLDYSHSAMASGIILSRPELTIKVDNTELETRIEETGKHKKGVFEPKARAAFLNKAIHKGLAEANFSASLSTPKFILSGLAYSLTGALMESWHEPPEMVVGNGILSQVLLAGLYGFLSSHEEGGKPLHYMKQARYSLFYGLTPDRYVAGGVLIGASKLIRARM